MKIALLTQYYKPEMGAPQNRLYEMVRGLRELGSDVTVVTAMPNYPTGHIFDKYKRHFRLDETIDGIKVRRYWLYASNSRRTLPRIWSMLSFTITSLFSLTYLRRWKPDCLIVESPPLTLAYTGRFLAKLSGAKYIANISDLWPLSAKELGALTAESPLYRLLEKVERSIYTHADSVMGQSDEIVQYIREHGGRNVYLFRNGVDPKRFPEAKAKKIKPSAPVKIIYAGLLGFAQGIADICRNINFHALGAELHIYGDGGERGEIETLLKEHPDRGIIYHGTVSRDQLPEILTRHDMTLIPLIKNIYGAVPSKIYESMAAGLPIMFMGEGEGAKIIAEHKLGLLARAKDYDQLQENIQYARSHTEELQQMAEHCLTCADTIYNRPKQIEALSEYLEKI